MTTETRTREVAMDRDLSGLAYECRQIYLPITPEAYAAAVADRHAFRAWVDAALGQYPELFPPEAQMGYVLHGQLLPSAKMPTVVRRRIKVAGLTYTLMPAYRLPYLTGTTDDVRDGFFCTNSASRIGPWRRSSVTTPCTGSAWSCAWGGTVWWGRPSKTRRSCPPTCWPTKSIPG